jgi:hypothetical protein
MVEWRSPHLFASLDLIFNAVTESQIDPWNENDGGR